MAPDEAGSPASAVTKLLQQWKKGDSGALDRLMPLVYDELRHMASRYLARERSDNTLQSTALVHEAFIRLVDQQHVDWQSRGHFFGLAAQMMRRILVDHARHAHRSKRGGGVTHLSIEDASMAARPVPVSAVDILELDGALRALEALDSTQARLVELRFFGGLTIDETAEVLEVSSSTAKREWAVAKAWLYRRMSGQSRNADAAP